MNIRVMRLVSIIVLVGLLSTTRTNGEQSNVVQLLRSRLYVPGLRLEFSGGVYRDAFQLSILYISGKENAPLEITAITDGQQSAYLASTTNGLPVSFGIDGFHARIAREHPGKLVVTKGRGPTGFFGIDDKGLVSIAFGTTVAPNEQLMLADFESVLKGAAQRVKSANWDEATNTAVIRTGRSELKIVLSSRCAEAQCLIKEMTFGGPDHQITVKGIEIQKKSGVVLPPALATPRLSRSDLLELTPKRIESLGIPMVERDLAEANEGLVPADFGKAPEELEVSKRLAELFQLREARPSR